MLIDVHTHTPRYRERPPEEPDSSFSPAWRPDQRVTATFAWADYLEALEPVDRAIVFNIAADPRGHRIDGSGVEHLLDEAQKINDETASFVRAHPERLIGFLSVHPFDPGALEEIDRATQELGLRGIKLAPNYQNFDPLSPEAFRIVRRAEELGLPILFHQGTSPVQFADLDYAHPRHLDRVAMAFPSLKIIMAHLGHPWQADCCVVVRKHPNVYADISAQFYRPWSYYNALRLATEWGVLDKLLFGSDYPFATPRETLDALYRVNDIIEGTRLPSVPIRELERIAQRDSLSLLGLV